VQCLLPPSCPQMQKAAPYFSKNGDFMQGESKIIREKEEKRFLAAPSAPNLPPSIPCVAREEAHGAAYLLYFKIFRKNKKSIKIYIYLERRTKAKIAAPPAPY